MTTGLTLNEDKYSSTCNNNKTQNEEKVGNENVRRSRRVGPTMRHVCASAQVGKGNRVPA